MSRLLLFDIDGTLLRSNGTGRRLVDRALCTFLGRETTSEGVSFSGKTDRQIFRELLLREAVSESDLDAGIDTLVASYSSGMEAGLDARDITVLPGVRALIARLREEGRHVMALLTGNLEPMAYLKLQRGALEDAFGHGPVRLLGAFGCDREDRNELPPVALERARAATGRSFSPEEVVVIGDTPRDIACARAHGCRVIAVATGRFDAESLARYTPDVLLTSLEDMDEVISALEA